MRSFHHSLFRTAAAILAITGARLDGQTSSAPVVPPDFRPGIDSSPGELSLEVRSYVTRGDALITMQRYAAGQQQYRQAIATTRLQGHLPSFTSWRLASAYYYEGRPERAARVLDELAAEAGGFGDLAVQSRALFNAAWLHGEAGQSADAELRIARLKKLLDSPYMPVAVRDDLVGRLAMPTAVTSR
ncbi:MAG: hypothetical protein E6K77_07355 [Candidatus Eisenbacteria bacterium]|uniref:Tetratricopeptide repeat protein n=1 Tax=Eiseniibacteriota bacterium TaxID=2212470 RepID=A0A538TFP4_UNCEI|nr:MAG: hypothetical protein E6K77_07355 [Candidatus Eisenbacteria bacterium]